MQPAPAKMLFARHANRFGLSLAADGWRSFFVEIYDVVRLSFAYDQLFFSRIMERIAE